MKPGTSPWFCMARAAICSPAIQPSVRPSSSAISPEESSRPITSARSGDLLGNGQMLVMRTTEDPTNPLGELVSAKQTLRLDHFSLAVNPFGLYGVQPRTLLGQQAAYDPNSSFAAALFDLAVVLAQPAPDLAAYVPACVVPDEKQDFLACRFELLAAPRKKLRRYGAHRPTIHKAQPRLLKLWQIEPVAGDGLWIGVVFSDRLLDQTHRTSFFGPATQGGQSQPTPPTLVLETHRPLRVGLRHAHQSVAPSFFFRTGDLER